MQALKIWTWHHIQSAKRLKRKKPPKIWNWKKNLQTAKMRNCLKSLPTNSRTRGRRTHLRFQAVDRFKRCRSRRRRLTSLVCTTTFRAAPQCLLSRQRHRSSWSAQPRSLETMNWEWNLKMGKMNCQSTRVFVSRTGLQSQRQPFFQAAARLGLTWVIRSALRKICLRPERLANKSASRCRSARTNRLKTSSND